MRIVAATLILIAALLSPIAGALPARALTPVAAVGIIEFNPDRGPVGTEVTVIGWGFTATGNAVNFAGAKNAITGLTAQRAGGPPKYGTLERTSLTFRVPATPCEDGLACDAVVIAPGTYPFSITNGGGITSTEKSFTITPFPQTLDKPTPPAPEPTPIFLEVRDAHTNAPVAGATVTVRGSKLFKQMLTANTDGAVKTEVPGGITVNHIAVSAAEYRETRFEGVALRAILEGQSRVQLVRVNPPQPPPYDPLHPPEGTRMGKMMGRSFAPPGQYGPPQGFWGRIRELFVRLFNLPSVRY